MARRPGLEPGLLGYKPSVLPLALAPRGAAGRTRTCDVLHTKEAVCHLTYDSLARATGLEPALVVLTRDAVCHSTSARTNTKGGEADGTRTRMVSGDNRVPSHSATTS